MKNYSPVEVIQAALEAAQTEMHVALPGRVVSYDAAKQTAAVQPTVKLPLTTADGEVSYASLPTIPDVPVAWPSGGGFFVAFGLTVGDPVLLVFSDISPADYLATGEDSEPKDTRRHSLGYPIAMPGGARPDTKALKDAPSAGVVIGKDNDEEQILIDADGIKLGKTATVPVVLADKMLAELVKIGTATAGAYVPPATASLIGATKVKAK